MSADATVCQSSRAQHESADTEYSSWGTADSSWGASTTDSIGGEQQATDAFDFSDLEQALSNSQLQGSSKASSKQHQKDSSTQNEAQQQQPAPSCGLEANAARLSLPGFYLHMSQEAARATGSMSAEDQHIADLVAAYQDETHKVHVKSTAQALHLKASCLTCTSTPLCQAVTSVCIESIAVYCNVS